MTFKNNDVKQIIILLLLYGSNVTAQDANYWTYQYGSRSTLLGGAVIGSVLDLSGTFYNPGAVSLIENPETILAAKVFEYPTYRLEGSFINDVEMSHSNLGPAPSLVATNIKFKWLGDNNFVLSLLTRNDLKFDLNYENVSKGNLENISDVITSFRVNERMNETWFGITWSYNYESKIGIGFTPYFVFRSHTTNNYTNFQTVSDMDDLYFAYDSRQFEYDHYSILLKAGITFDFIGQTFGLTITTPRLGYYTNGSSGTNQTIQGIPPAGSNEEIKYVAADYQNDVSVTFKSPLSVGIGTTFKIEKTNIYVSAEWFSPIGKYDVIVPNVFEPQIGEGTISNGVTSESQAVLNAGIGIQHTFSNTNTINASFTTDFSASLPESDTNHSFASWDIYHLMLGGSLNFLDWELTLGIGYAYGKELIKRQYNSQSDDSNSTIDEVFDGADFSYQSFKFVLGFAI